MPKVIGYSYHPSLGDFIYTRKKHYCPHCGVRMERETAIEVLRPFDYTWGIRSGKLVHYSNATSKWHYPVLQCPNCGCVLTIAQMKEYDYQGFSKGKQRLMVFGKGFLCTIVVLTSLFAIVPLVVAVLYNAYKESYIPQNVVDFFKSIVPENLWEFLKSVIKK